MEEKKYKFCQIDKNNCTVKELEEEKKLQSQLKAATNNKRLYG